MRRLVATGGLVAALVVAPAPTLGHPGHGPTEVYVADNILSPGTATIATGDTVVWKWYGPVANHSVTADPGQPESFDSDPGKQPAEIDHATGFVFTHTFTRLGRFTYRCRVHPAMRGTVLVIAPVAPDVIGPRLTKVSLRPNRICARHTSRCRRSRSYLRLTSSEPASIVGRIDRRKRGRWRLARTLSFHAPKGRFRTRLRLNGLQPGPFRLRLVAYDNSDNSSALTTLRFRLRKPYA